MRLTVEQILALFDSEMRAFPPLEVGQRIERSDGIVLTLGRYNTVVFSQLEAADVDRVVGKHASAFSELGEDVEWKLYAHDAPANLSASLLSHGFEPEAVETLMVLPLQPGGTQILGPSDVDVRRVRTCDDVATYIEVTSRAFGACTQAKADLELRLLRTDPDMIAFVAHVDDKPAAAGRLELPRDRSFASLWGGGTDPLLRKRGVYRALVAERARLAREAGYRYLTVDARETSRPILERLGFEATTTVVAWNLTARRR